MERPSLSRDGRRPRESQSLDAAAIRPSEPAGYHGPMTPHHLLDAAATRVAAFIPRLGAALGVLAAFGVATAAVSRVLRRPPPARRVPRELWTLFGRGVKAVMLAFGLLSALGTMGVDVSALVAGLGLTGFALGFAVRDALSNVLAGILTLVYQPFRSGDRILVTGLEGEVIDVDLRYTTLEADGKRHLVPNSSLFSNPVTVFARGAASGPGQPLAGG
jgi:small conductance mechanosensitive channel